MANQLALLLALTFQSGPLHGGDPHELRCSVCSCDCVPTQVHYRKVRVPTMVTETRTKYVTEMKMEQHELPYTVFQRVPVTRTYSKEKCYLADETRTKVVSWKEPRLVQNPTVKTINVLVPETEIRTGLCDTCGTDACSCVTASSSACCDTCTQQPCTCQVTVMRPDVRTENGCAADVVFETKSKVISYCVKTPKKTKEVCAEETVYKLVPVEKTKTVEVCVPVKIPTAVEVQTCKMITKYVPCCPKCAGKR